MTQTDIILVYQPLHIRYGLLEHEILIVRIHRLTTIIFTLYVVLLLHHRVQLLLVPIKVQVLEPLLVDFIRNRKFCFFFLKLFLINLVCLVLLRDWILTVLLHKFTLLEELVQDHVHARDVLDHLSVLLDHINDLYIFQRLAQLQNTRLNIGLPVQKLGHFLLLLLTELPYECLPLVGLNTGDEAENDLKWLIHALLLLLQLEYRKRVPPLIDFLANFDVGFLVVTTFN